MLKRIDFIPPMAPTRASAPPMGSDWLHEAKLDGWRARVHVNNGEGRLYSKNGAGLTRRFGALKSTIADIPARSAVIDCELVACDAAAQPNFRMLMELGGKAPALFLWAFDSLYLDGVRITALPLIERRAQLADLVASADNDRLQFSGEFKDPLRLLAAGEQTQLESIVSKRRSSPYRPGPTREWLKIKTAAWRTANRDRGELFRT